MTITAEDLVESMDGISTTISKQWVGLVLLPAVSSIAGMYKILLILGHFDTLAMQNALLQSILL